MQVKLISFKEVVSGIDFSPKDFIEGLKKDALQTVNIDCEVYFLEGEINGYLYPDPF